MSFQQSLEINSIGCEYTYTHIGKLQPKGFWHPFLNINKVTGTLKNYSATSTESVLRYDFRAKVILENQDFDR